MKCQKCGNIINDNQVICHICGYNNQQNENIMTIDAALNKKLDTSLEKPNKKIIKIILIILIFIILIVSIIFGYNAFNGYVSKVKEEVTYNIYYKNYNFEILNKYIYNNDEINYLTFTDETNNWLAKIDVFKGNYNRLNEQYLKLKPLLEVNDIIVKNIIKKRIDGRDYIAIEVVNNGENELLLYTELDDNNIIAILLVNKNYTHDYVYLDNVKPIIENIKIRKDININIQEFVLPNIDLLLN